MVIRGLESVVSNFLVIVLWKVFLSKVFKKSHINNALVKIQ